MLTPYRAERMVKAFNEEIGLPVHIHCHYVGGMAPANILKAAEAGVAVADTAHAPLAFGNSHPAVEMIVAALKESRYDTDLDLDLLFEISEYWEEMRKRGHYKRGVSSLIHMQVYSHQVPGGMMSNLISQLEVQKAAHRLPEVMAEIPKVRAEVGYPPLVTPMSQIVGTQAVFNVLTGKRWSVISKEMKDYVCGYYGKAPGNMDKEIVAKVAGDAEILRSEDRPRHAGDHHLRRVRRRDWRFGPKRGGRAHVRPVPQRGPHLFEQAPGIRESRFHAGAGVQRHQGGRLRGHQSDSRAGSRCRGERRRRDRRRGRGHAHRCPHARPGRAGRCRARRSAGPGGSRCRRARAGRRGAGERSSGHAGTPVSGSHGGHLLRGPGSGRAARS